MASQQVGWTIDEYATADGERPIRAFISVLTGRAKVEAVAWIKLLEERGNALRRPQSAPLGGGLFELRGDQARIFYLFRPGRRIVLLNGVLKKQRKVPAEALKRAKRYQKEIRAMYA